MERISRRRLITTTTVFGAYVLLEDRMAWAARTETRFDFSRPLEGWQTVSGKWTVEEVAGAQGARAGAA